MASIDPFSYLLTTHSFTLYNTIYIALNKIYMRETQTFDFIRIVHTNEIWQHNDSGWCEISVYDKDNNLITSGHDHIMFQGKTFSMDCHKDKPGFNCYMGKFELELGYNTLTITVK